MLSDHSIHAYLLRYHMSVSIIPRRALKPTQCQGSRTMHLVHHLFTADIDKESPKQLASLKRVTYPRADEVSLKLVEKGNDEVATMTLSQALQRLKPRSYLAKAGPGAYCIETFPDPGPQKVLTVTKPSYKPYTRAGRGKETHVSTSCTPQLLRHYLRTSYSYLLQGARMEYHLHQNVKEKTRTVAWALAHCLDLRPESILAAMPEGTTMLGDPVVTDLSFKTRPSKNPERAKSQMMWIMENTQVRGVEGTPQRVTAFLAKLPFHRKQLEDETSPVVTPKDV